LNVTNPSQTLRSQALSLDSAGKSAGIVSLMLIFVCLVLALFVGILTCLEVGWRVRSKNLATETEKSDAGLNAIDGAVFALMGLLIAFTFSGAATRFEELCQPSNAYALELQNGGADTTPRLVWKSEVNGRPVNTTIEPSRSRWQRIKMKLLLMLPLDREL